jgi:hypothetical protein
VHLDETKERAKGRRQRVTVEEEKNKLKGRGKKGRAREMIVGRRKRMREEEGHWEHTAVPRQVQRVMEEERIEWTAGGCRVIKLFHCPC